MFKSNGKIYTVDVNYGETYEFTLWMEAQDFMRSVLEHTTKDSLLIRLSAKPFVEVTKEELA